MRGVCELVVEETDGGLMAETDADLVCLANLDGEDFVDDDLEDLGVVGRVSMGVVAGER